MAADVQIRVWNGAAGSPTQTTVTGANSRYHSADVHSAASLDNSILIPDSGSNHSYWKSLRLNVVTITNGVVDNIRVYRDGANGYGAGVTEHLAPAATYVQATGTVGVTGDVLNTTNHTGLNSAPVDSFNYTSASPLSVAGSNSAAGDFGDFVVAQLIVANTAAPGTIPTETLTFLYDDTSS